MPGCRFPDGSRIDPLPDGLRVVAPAPRAPRGALALVAFGAVTILITAASARAALPAHWGDGAGLLASVLLAAFVLPVAAFGLVFLATGLAALGTSRLTRAAARRLHVSRHFAGVPTGTWNLAPEDIRAIEVRQAPKYQNLGAGSPRRSVVAALRLRTAAVVICDGLDEESAMRLRTTLAQALRLPDEAPSAATESTA